MDWASYVDNVIARVNGINKFSVKIGDTESDPIPSVLVVSIDILNSFLDTGEKHLVMVFPEIAEGSFLFSILKIIDDFSAGRIKHTYNPTSFKKGQKLKCKNCVVEFDCVEEKDGDTILWVRDADCRVGISIELAPFFQLAETNRRLSKDSEFGLVKKQIRQEKAGMGEDKSLLMKLSDYKTHLNNAVFNVYPIGNAKKLLASMSINDTNIQDLLLFGYADPEGNVEIINKGQLKGEPSIVFASDLYAVYEAIKKGSDVKCLLVNPSNDKLVQNQLDVLDVLRKKDFPIVFITDTANSFELDLLEQRGFFIWRWDEETILESIYSTSGKLKRKMVNCVKRELNFIDCESTEISDSFAILYRNKSIVTEQTANVQSIYDRLYSLAFLFLRTITEFPLSEKKELNINLELCKTELNLARRYISAELYNDFNTIIGYFEIILGINYEFPKVKALMAALRDKEYESVCLVVPDQADPQKNKQYWANWCQENSLNTTVDSMRADEYINSKVIDCENTIICGWIKQDKMKRILYGYQTHNFVILLYDYEKRWKDPYISLWERRLFKGDTRKVLDKAYPNIKTTFKELPAYGAIHNDELDEINMILRENKYRQYLASGSSRNLSEIVEAIPVNYVGSSFAFYKSSHKLLVVTDIVLNRKNEIQMLLPTELAIGDFIVVRESQQDLVREMADKILAESGKSEIRALATKWKDALEVESIYSSYEEIYHKLQVAGCKKGWVTFKQWMKSDDIIIPQDKNDLQIIAIATGDSALLENIDDIYEAGKKVRSAHVQAGKNLSLLLKTKIAEKLQEIGNIDPYSIWEPISMYIDNIGPVKVLKVIDIGKEELVDASNINRLFDEF